MNIFEKISNFVNGAEDSVINLLTVIAPWLVPVIPAFLTYWHTERDLGFPSWIAWTSAIVVEVLGLASMRTSISFFEHNKRYTKDTNKAPFWLAVSTYIFYLMVIMAVNVLLDVTNNIKWTNITAIALFSLLSVPAGLLISVRAQHSELLKDIAERRMITNQTRTQNKQNEPPKRKRTANRTLNGSMDVRQRIKNYVRSVQANEQRTPGPTEIANKLGISKGYASDTLKSIANETKPSITY